jgi:hypothetical protein
MYRYGIVLVARDPMRLAESLLMLSRHGLSDAHIVIVPRFDADAVEAIADASPLKTSVLASIVESEECSISRALSSAMTECASDARLVVLSDDVRLPSHWLVELESVFSAKTVRNESAEFSADAYGTIGCVGPVSDGIAKPAQYLTLQESELAMGIDRYAMHRRQYVAGVGSIADTLDPCLLMMTRDYAALLEQVIYFSDTGAYAWQTAYLRAAALGIRCAVAEGCYVARMTPERPGAWEPGNGAHRIESYLQNAKHQGPHKVVATISADIRTLRDLTMLEATIASVTQPIGAIALGLGNNPLDVLDDPSFQLARSRNTVAKHHLDMLKGCAGGDQYRVAGEVMKWMQAIASEVGRKGLPVSAKINVHGDDYGTRCAAYEAAEALAGTWFLLLEPGELLDSSVTRDYLHRVASHPDAGVLAYDCGFITHYNLPTQIRADGPRGSGSSTGPSGVRLVRWLSNKATRPMRASSGACTIAPVYSEESVRAANIRIRQLDALRESDRDDDEAGSVAVRPYHDATRIGFHCLTYEAENTDDLARWLDIATGVCDRSVLVWTSEAPLNAEIQQLGCLFGAEIVHHPLRDNLAAARNAGIQALHDAGGLTWAWFVDPDEWFDKPLHDARSMRLMAEQSRYGFLVQTCNYRRGEAPSISDSVRMTRLDKEGIIRMDGRVHEGFSDAWKALQAKGRHPRLVYAPFVVQHRGMSFTPERMRQKLDKYERLLRLELQDRPDSPGAWVSLGWHYFNDGAPDEGVECFRRAVDCAGQSYLPYRELAYWHLREAQKLVAASMDRLAPSHQWYKAGKDLQRALVEHVQPMQQIARDENRTIEPLPAYMWK